MNIFAQFVQPLLGTILCVLIIATILCVFIANIICVWKIWSGSNNCIHMLTCITIKLNITKKTFLKPSYNQNLETFCFWPHKTFTGQIYIMKTMRVK